MQTFLPYEDYDKSARTLDMMRLGKQRVETLQILQRLMGERLVTSDAILVTKRVSRSPKNTPENEILWEEQDFVRKIPRDRNEWTREPITSVGWTNHPAVKMWRGSELELLKYQEAICNEWTRRGYQDTCLEKSIFLMQPHLKNLSTSKPQWLGDEKFHQSHRSNLLRKDEHYREFFPEDPDDLPYEWPVGG